MNIYSNRDKCKIAQKRFYKASYHKDVSIMENKKIRDVTQVNFLIEIIKSYGQEIVWSASWCYKIKLF